MYMKYLLQACRIDLASASYTMCTTQGMGTSLAAHIDLAFHIALLAGSNAFRLSIEWSRIMPAQGQIDQKAIERYHQMFDCIDK